MAYVPGAVLIAVLVAGCSAGGEGDASTTDSKPGTLAASAAPPGRYRTLPEPCRALSLSTLKDLLPGAAQLPEAQQEKVYEGTPAGTFDTDRRVGCAWKSDAAEGSRSLSVDFERVVSYDPAVSDDDRAREVYAKKEAAADLPASGLTTDSGDTGDTKGGDGGGSGTAAPGATPSAGADGTAGVPAEDLRPRVLDSLGDSAFLDDVLTRAGSTARHRTVSVVFRTSNVIVTIAYTVQPALPTEVPDSAELQDKAQALGQKLVDRFSE
ncbi:DUF3558 domain-containing protein [Streptomyces sp. NPDC001478]